MPLRPILQILCTGLSALLIAVFSSAPAARAATCSIADFAKAVDEAGAGLRAYNVEAQPKITERMQQLKTLKGWPDDSFQERAVDYLRDAKTQKLDEQSNELLAKIDMLGRPDDAAVPDCAKLDDLKASSLELLAVMKAKSAYLLAKMDAEIAAGRSAATTATSKAPDRPAQQPRKSVTPDRDVAVVAPPPAKAPDAKWDTTTTTVLAPPPHGLPDKLPEVGPLDLNDGYTIDEIRAASQGFFGTISTNLASVLESSVKSWGLPTGYVLGKEGGGALLAGLRYGEGTLYMRSGGTKQVYWHGPSLGYDVGAAGSRTMFLIYRLKKPDDLLRSFSGLDGSAYLGGGVGITFLKGGEVIMAPVRSGVGLRLGASIGYIRFTDHATWNPF